MSIQTDFFMNLEDSEKDAIVEHYSDHLDKPVFSIRDITKAIKALREHRELKDGLFDEDDEPTDRCLEQIHNFLIMT